MRRTASVILVMLVVSGCAMTRHRAQVRDGLLTLNLHREAFRREWGLPTRTDTMPGDQVTQASFGGSRFGASGFFFSGKRTYEVWTYGANADDGVILVFNGYRLAGWKTSLTTRELQGLKRH